MTTMFVEPVSATMHSDPVMVLGIVDGSMPYALVVSSDGAIRTAALEELNVDWRYDWKTGKWVDVGPYEDEDGGDEEASDGGGQEVPGDVPGPD